MDIRVLSKRDKMRRMEIKDLRKQVSKLTNLLNEKEIEIESLKRMRLRGRGDTMGIDGFFAAIY